MTSEEQALELNKLPRYTGQWNVEINSSTTDHESLLLVWLEEVLYRLEVKGKFLVDAQILIQPKAESLTCQSQVSYVEGDLVKRHLEIKAVTSHDLLVKNLISGEVFSPVDVTIPEMWVLLGLEMSFLIFSGNSKDGRTFNMAKSTHFLHPATPQHPWP